MDELSDMRHRLNIERDGYDDSGQWKDKKLEDEFEPIILAERYMTDKDDRIQEIDIPERMQVNRCALSSTISYIFLFYWKYCFCYYVALF